MQELRYKTIGKGNDIVLLHGWSGNIKSLEPLASCLSEKGYRVTLFEWPGSGESKVPDNPLTLFNYVDILKGNIERLNLIDPVLVGHSFGGKVILKSIVTYPDIYNRVVLIDSSGIRPKNSVKRMIFKYISKLGKMTDFPIIKNFKEKIRYQYYRYIVKEMDYIRSQEMKDTFKNIIKEDLDEYLSKIRARTLIIWGEKDNITPLWMGEKLNKSIKGSRLVIVKDKRHSLPLVDPLRVSNEIYNFLHNIN